jgi:EpsG family
MGYYLVLPAVAVLSLFARGRAGRYVVIAIIAILTVFAGTRFRVDNDYDIYAYLFGIAAQGGLVGLQVEPSVWAIPRFLGLFFDSTSSVIQASFVVFAALGVSTKVVGMKLYSQAFPISIFLYLSYLYLVQEMTAIRSGVAAGIFLLAIGPLLRREHVKYFAMVAVAFLFHTSSVLFVIAWVPLMLRVRLAGYLVALAASVGIAVLRIDLPAALQLGQLFERVEAYLADGSSYATSVNLFSFRILFSLGMLVALGIRYEKLKEVRWFPELYRLHIMSLIVFFALSPTVSVFALRGFELLSVVQLLLYPMLLHGLKPAAKYFACLMLIGFSIIQLNYLVDISGIFKEYASWVL